MKTIIENLLIELTALGKRYIELDILSNAEKKLSGSDLLTLTGWLMHWHKKIKKGFPIDQYQNDYLDLSDFEVLQPKYKILFESCPELSELYELKGDKIYFNSSLTEEEKQEILNYVDDNYKIIRHSYGRKH